MHKLPMDKIQRDSKGLSAAPRWESTFNMVQLFCLGYIADENTFWILNSAWNPNNGLETYLPIAKIGFHMFPSTHALNFVAR